MKKIINIEGMSCGHCVAHVREALEELDGTEVIEVSLENKNAIINTAVDDTEIMSAIDEAGYDVKSIN